MNELEGSAIKRVLAIAQRRGINTADVARLAGVSRMTLYNWQDGKPAHKSNIAKLIFGLGLTGPSGREEIFDYNRIKESFNANDIRRMAAIDSLWGDLESLFEALAQSSHVSEIKDLLIMKLWGKRLFEAALSKRTRVDAFLIPYSIMSPKDASKEHFDDILNMAISEMANHHIYCIPSDYSLEDFERGYSTDVNVSSLEWLHRYSSKHIEDVTVDQVLKACAGSDGYRLQEGEAQFLNDLHLNHPEINIKKITLYWGFGNSGSKLQWLLEWISDVDGQKILGEIFKNIRHITVSGSGSLIIPAIDRDTYINENRTDEDYDGEDAINEWFGPDGEWYRTGDESYLYGNKEIPLEKEMIALFFEMMGFKTRYKCDHPKNGHHQLILKW